MDSKLPSLSIYWLKYHDIGIRAIGEGNYVGAIGAIYSMNALLPDEYRISVDTAKFLEVTKAQFKVICSHCNYEIDRNGLNVFDLLLSNIDSFITGKKSERVWYCTDCKAINPLLTTKIKKLENASPFFYKVIPEPPKRPMGLEGRTIYHNATVIWFYRALEELDHQLGKYRAEYESIDSRDDVTDHEEEFVQY